MKQCVLITVLLILIGDFVHAQPITPTEKKDPPVSAFAYPSYRAKRLNDSQPLIESSAFAALGVPEEGLSIAGPSIIRIPSWIAPEERIDPSAIYYLYFAHHRGKYIRLAWSTSIEGPWTLYRTGAQVPIGQRGVLDLGGAPIDIGNRVRIPDNHIASPDVIVDEQNRQIVLYFHSGSKITVNGTRVDGQKSFVSTSANGLAFRDHIQPVILGESYMRVFNYSGRAWAMGGEGRILGGVDAKSPWSTPKDWVYSHDLWPVRNNDMQQDIENGKLASTPELQVRHADIRLAQDPVKGDVLEVFYSHKGLQVRDGIAYPERILLSRFRIDANLPAERWDSVWPFEEILMAEMEWEGGNLPVRATPPGMPVEASNALQDPDFFLDQDGRTYLFYVGGGERGIGVAELTHSH